MQEIVHKKIPIKRRLYIWKNNQRYTVNQI